MLQAHGLSLTLDPRVGPLFQDVTLTLHPGEKVVLVGDNGSGKSMLLQLLVGSRSPDQGRVTRPRAIGYLRQDFDLAFSGTLSELLDREAPDFPEYRRAAVLHRLGLRPETLDQPYATLSLGERMRGALAILLAEEPEVLLLDEPTNHLDQGARKWLTGFIQGCPEACLVVTHDRSFADKVADRVLELDAGSLTTYRGNLSDMREEKATRTAQQRADFERQKREDHRLRVTMEAQYQRAADVTKRPTNRDYSAAAKPFYAAKQARMDKRASAMRSRLEQARAHSVDKPFEPKDITLEFPMRPLRTEEVLRVRNLSHSFGPRELFRGLNITLLRGERVAILGANGAGKTTLFRLLRGELVPRQGEITWAPGSHVEVLSQARDRLSPHLALADAVPGDPSFVRSALGRLGIRGDKGETRVGDLSVGERTKAEIVAMMATGANVLILDEPTNHLDLRSLEALESALTEFPGAILFTSHDASFVVRVATEQIRLE